MKAAFIIKRAVYGITWFFIGLGMGANAAGQGTSSSEARKQRDGASSQQSVAPGESSATSPHASGPLEASIAGNVYTNRFFGFSLPFPQGWMVVPNLRAETRAQRNQNELEGMNARSESSVRPQEADSLSLLVVVENAPGKPPFQWRRLVVLANRLRDPNLPIKDHLKAGAQLLRDRHSPAQMIGEPEPVVIAGRKFWKQRMTQLENGVTYHLLMFATGRKNYSLQLILWGTDDAGVENLESVISSLQFL